MLQARYQQDPNSGPNRHKIGPFGVHFGDFPGPGGPCGPLVGGLGVVLGVGGVSWGFLERLGAVLGGNRLGNKPFWTPKGAP